MPWLQIKIDCDSTQAPMVSDALIECGALSVTFSDVGDQPLYEPSPGTAPLWRQTRVTGLFEANVDTRAVLAILATLPNHASCAHIELLQDQAWERTWMDHFVPTRFGKHLWICPSWCDPPDPDAINIHLDPGLAFGTGSHDTTALCLEWLDAHPPLGCTVIDYGCGSGILAIASALLGAQRVIAVDNDPQALHATLENAQRNGVDEKIEIYAPEQLPPARADLIVANILANPLISLASLFARLCHDKAQIVLSGILAHQAADVLDAYAGWFTMNPPLIHNDWARLDGVFTPTIKLSVAPEAVMVNNHKII